MTRQLEDAEDAHQPDDSEDGQRLGLRAAARARRRRRCPRRVDELSSERDEVRQNGDEVDDVHGVAEERRAVRTEREADRQLGREPDDAARLDDKEWVRAVVVVGSPRL